MINNVFEHGTKTVSFNEGRVVLLIKPGGEHSQPKYYRPICLLNTDYKIVTTILARHLRETLLHVVSQAQVCSVPGRTITLRLTRDLFTFAVRTGISGCVVSLDQSKAVDQVEHRYLFAALRGFGYPRVSRQTPGVVHRSRCGRDRQRQAQP